MFSPLFNLIKEICSTLNNFLNLEVTLNSKEFVGNGKAFPLKVSDITCSIQTQTKHKMRGFSLD